MITPTWIIGFTGHRPKDSPGRTSTEMKDLAETIHKELAVLQAKALAQEGRAEFLCGLAAGADVIAAQQAEKLGMPVHVILPMQEEEFKKDFLYQPPFAEKWAQALGMPALTLLAKIEEHFAAAEAAAPAVAPPPSFAAAWAQALGMQEKDLLKTLEEDYQKAPQRRLLAADWKEAQKFIGLARAGTGGATFRVAHGSQLRDDCYYDVGSQIVYASDAIIALWDGKAAPEVAQMNANTMVTSPGRGGTADVVALARADRMPYLKGTKPKHGYKWLPTPLRLINPLTKEVAPEADAPADHFASATDAGLAEMKEVQHAAHVRSGKHTPLDTAKGLMGFVDHCATDWATRLRLALLLVLGLHFLASLIAAVSASAQETANYKDIIWMPPALATLELALVGLAVFFIVWAHLKHAQHRWLELRLATELTRSLADCGRLLDPLFPIATDHLPGWRRFCLSVGLVIWRDPETAPPVTDQAGQKLTPAEQLEKVKKHYLERRIKIQRDHYDAKTPIRRHLWYRMAEWASTAFTGLAVGFILNALIYKWDLMHHPGSHEITPWGAFVHYFLPIALPLAAAAIASLQAVTDVKRRAHVYPEMVERLLSAEGYLTAVRTNAALGRFVRRTEEILLDELVGWYAAAKGISH